jgi:hypothetical protein
VYDIPLVLSSKQYKKDGTLYSTKGETDSFWGDIIHVVSHHHQENSSLITVALI